MKTDEEITAIENDVKLRFGILQEKSKDALRGISDYGDIELTLNDCFYQIDCIAGRLSELRADNIEMKTRVHNGVEKHETTGLDMDPILPPPGCLCLRSQHPEIAHNANCPVFKWVEAWCNCDAKGDANIIHPAACRTADIRGRIWFKNDNKPDIKTIYERPVAVAETATGSVQAGSVVTMYGSKSHDIGGKPLTYRWKQTFGKRYTLRNAETSMPYFFIKDADSDSTVKFILVVTNEHGVESLPAKVSVMISMMTEVFECDADGCHGHISITPSIIGDVDSGGHVYDYRTPLLRNGWKWEPGGLIFCVRCG